MVRPIKIREAVALRSRGGSKPLRGILGRSEFKRPLHGSTPGERVGLQAEALVEWEAAIAATRAELSVVSVKFSKKPIRCAE